MKSVATVLAAFKTLGTNYRGFFIRIVPLRYIATPISAIGSILDGGRYNAQGRFEMLYLANIPDTAVREVGFVVRDPSTGRDILVPQEPSMNLTVHVELQHVVDLRSTSVRNAIGVSRKALLGDWELDLHHGVVPITQRIGDLARAAGAEAIFVPSAAHSKGWNFNIIVDNLRRGSFVEINAPSPGFPPGTLTRIDGKR